MKYLSTNKQSPIVDFKEATIKGQAPDKGLYFPELIPQLDKNIIADIENISKEDIAFKVIHPYIGNTISDERLFEIVTETVNFNIPLVQLNEKIASLELFHGPTLAFKDIGARFMSRCLGHFMGQNDDAGRNPALSGGLNRKKVTVLVATSGDTGGAVANGFYDVDGVDVVILYPSGKVSPVQEKQLTTLGKNIRALEVLGTFDDCQSMVKQAFTDQEINEKLFLTSANSINIARWLPQQFYYFYAYKQWISSSLGAGGNPPVISVPSGNFGNICAGILAMQSGLPVKHFIAACNVNDILSEYLSTQQLKTKEAVPTLSNAMDVGNPSNFIRILELFQHQFPELKSKLSAYTITDQETMDTIKAVYQLENYILDPHGAVGYLSLLQYLNEHQNEKGIFLETAHPVKFPEAVENCIGKPIEIPESVKYIMKAEKQSVLLNHEYTNFKEYLLQ